MTVGITAQRPAITWCVGDEVTYICTVNSPSHIWESKETVTPISSGGQEVNIDGPYTFKRLSMVGVVPIITSVSVAAHARLNNTLLRCRDGTVASGHPRADPPQDNIIMVFGELL